MNNNFIDFLFSFQDMFSSSLGLWAVEPKVKNNHCTVYRPREAK